MTMKGINFKCIKPTSNSYQRRHNLVASPIGFLCGAPWKLKPLDAPEAAHPDPLLCFWWGASFTFIPVKLLLEPGYECVLKILNM